MCEKLIKFYFVFLINKGLGNFELSSSFFEKNFFFQERFRSEENTGLIAAQKEIPRMYWGEFSNA